MFTCHPVQQRHVFHFRNVLKGFVAVALTLLFSFSSQLVAKSNIYVPPTDRMAEVTYNKKFLAENPTSANAYFELAMSYAYTGQIQKGWDTLKKIPDYDKNFAPKVFAKYTPLAKQNPKEWRYPFKLAFAYYFIDDRDKAITEFEKVLKIDPKHIWAMGFIALIQGEQSKEEDALNRCKQALAIEPNATAIHFLAAEGYRRQGKYLKMTQHSLKVGQLMLAEKQSGLYND